MPVLKIIQIRWLPFIILCSIFQINAQAEEIYLKNGDRLTAEAIIKEDEGNITIKTEAMGEITIRRDFVKRISGVKEEVPEAKKTTEVIWQRELSLGYNKSSGNTKTNQLSLSLFVNRKIEQVNEFTLKGDTYYSSSNEKMDTQKWSGMIRYAYSFGENKRWYKFYKFETDHDRFANIDYRIIPVVGIGHWFYDLPEIKLMAELGMGLEHTVYRDQTEDSDEIILTPRAFLEREIFDNSKLSQNILLYPNVEDFSIYRIRSETTLATSLNQKLTWHLSLIDDYNSNPFGSAKSNDLRLISSLAYSF